MEAWICCQPLSMNKIQARVFLRKMLGTWLDLQGPDFYDPRDPVFSFSHSRDPILNSRDPDRDL